MSVCLRSRLRAASRTAVRVEEIAPAEQFACTAPFHADAAREISVQDHDAELKRRAIDRLPLSGAQSFHRRDDHAACRSRGDRFEILGELRKLDEQPDVVDAFDVKTSVESVIALGP